MSLRPLGDVENVDQFLTTQQRCCNGHHWDLRRIALMENIRLTFDVDMMLEFTAILDQLSMSLRCPVPTSHEVLLPVSSACRKLRE